MAGSLAPTLATESVGPAPNAPRQVTPAGETPQQDPSVPLEWMIELQAAQHQWPQRLREALLTTLQQPVRQELTPLARVRQQLGLSDGTVVQPHRGLPRLAPATFGQASGEFTRSLLSFGAFCECYCNQGCDDGLFCNGAEFCQAADCVAAAPPDCDDADACTLDSCDTTADECLSEPVPPPLEVSGLLLDRFEQSTALLSWDPAPDAETYNLYQGTMVGLGDLACLGSATTNVVSDTGATPDPNGLFVYLVTATDCFESTLGDSSSGVPRSNNAPCH